MIAIDKLILIVLFLIILVVGIYLVVSYILPTGINVNLQNELRACCQKYRAFGCPDEGLLGDINCDKNNLFDLYHSAGFSDIKGLKSFCNC
jgi:hypothetical protein